MSEIKETPYEELSQRKQRKYRYRQKLDRCLNEYKNVLLVSVDNVGSRQMQQVRISLRGKGEVLMGKNTIIRKVIREHLETNPKLEVLLQAINGNMGFVFTNGDLAEVRKIVLENKVPASARSGAIAPVDVYVQPGPTGLDPGQTAFFQALNIATKIARGCIEILTKVPLIKKGDKVTSSAVVLLNKLGIKPFFYGVIVDSVYENGAFYSAAVLDLTQDDLLNKFFTGVRHIAALSFACNHPTQASVGHSLINGFKKLLAISLATDYTFTESKIFKDYLENPDLLKKAAGGGGDDEQEEEEEEEEEDEESDGNIGGGMFGEGGDDY